MVLLESQNYLKRSDNNSENWYWAIVLLMIVCHEVLSKNSSSQNFVKVLLLIVLHSKLATDI